MLPQVRLRQKLSLGAVTSFFTGKEAEKDPAVVKLEELKVCRGGGERKMEEAGWKVGSSCREKGNVLKLSELKVCRAAGT